MTSRLQHFRSGLIVGSRLVGLLGAVRRGGTAGARLGRAADPQLIEDLVAAEPHSCGSRRARWLGPRVACGITRDPNRYLMSRRRCRPDLDHRERYLWNSTWTAGPSIRTACRCRRCSPSAIIHGEIYKMRPDVMAIVHTHAPSFIPFGVTKVPLKPVYHRSAFISSGIPVFEIRERAGMTDMLIRDPRHSGVSLPRCSEIIRPR